MLVTALLFANAGLAADDSRNGWPLRAPVLVRTLEVRAFQPGGAAEELLQRAVQDGKLPVIVGLRMTLQNEDSLSPKARAEQALSLRAMQDRVIARTLGPTNREISRHTFIPFIAFFATATEIRKLFADPEVVTVEEDALLAPMLDYSVPLIHADDIYGKGKTASGYVVAILDSGVSKTHPFFAGKIVSEACFSTNEKPNFQSLCPGGAPSSVAPGSGTNCPVSVFGCDHGTHVASIAAGGGGHPGIAKGAKIIAIKVASRYAASDECGSGKPCVYDRGDDMIRGLDRVLALRGSFKIAAVNISFGGGIQNADCDGLFPAAAAAFNRVRAAGIAVVVSAGNKGSANGVSMPACLKNAITVGWSGRGDSNNEERVDPNSNYGKLIELTAPGTDINAALPPEFPGPDYGKKSGTSMSAPHVTGAFAILKQAKPDATVKDILEALECSGKTVVRPYPDGIDKPRIDLLGAYYWLSVPNSRREWTFDKGEEGLDWTPYLGTWHVKGGEYAPDSVPNGAVFSSTANCNRKLDVTVTIKRTYASGGNTDPERYPNAGIMLKSKLDYQTHTMSGYFFGYNYFPRQKDPDKAWGFIQRIENNSQTKVICWKTDHVPVNYNAWNTLRAISIGSSHRLYLNGKLICAGTDSTFEHGPVAALTGFSTSYKTTAGKFSISQLSIKGIDTIDDAAAPALDDSPSKAPPVQFQDGGLIASMP